jgi:hypothetical protein
MYEAERRWVQAIMHACGSPLTSYFLICIISLQINLWALILVLDL